MLALLAGTASPALALQAPDVTVVLRGSDNFLPSPTAPSFVSNLTAGADFGWAVAGMINGAGGVGTSALFGDLSPGGTNGGQILRSPMIIGMYVQSHLHQPSTARGRLAYIDSTTSSLGSGGTSVWLDSQLIAQEGNAVANGDTWLRFRDVTHTTAGMTYVYGQLSRTSGLSTGVVSYPGAAVILETGDSFPGLPGPVGIVRDFNISRDGTQWISRVTGTTFSSAVIANGSVLDLGGGSLAVEGMPVPLSVAPAGWTLGQIHRAMINDDGDVAITAVIVDGVSSEVVNIRNGRLVESSMPGAIVGSLEAIDPRGFAATLEGNAFVSIDAVPMTGVGSTVDVDGDGQIDAGWSVRVHTFFTGVALSADGSDLYWIAELRGPASVSAAAVVRLDRYGVAQPTCGGRPNSTGAAAHITAVGSNDVAINELTLQCIEMPNMSAGIFLASMTPGFTMNASGSQGDLCLGGSIGRYSAVPFFSGSTGRAVLGLDLTSIPQPMGPVAASVGSTWYFQAWYRDAVGGQATSNFSDAVAVALR